MLIRQEKKWGAEEPMSERSLSGGSPKFGDQKHSANPHKVPEWQGAGPRRRQKNPGTVTHKL
eukprot:2898700-Prymnesium_polylepis.1